MILRFLLGLFLALVSITTQAQSAWTAWVYTPADGSVVRISAQGEIIDAYRLPLNPAFNAYGVSALVSPNGRFVAYTVADTITGGGNQQLVVYDTQAGFIRFTYDLTGVDADGLSFAQFPHSAAFDESAQTLAFGVVRGGEWELVVANLATEMLSGGEPLTAATAAISADGGLSLPVPEIVRGNAVRFFLLPVSNGVVGEYTAYFWTPGQAVVDVGASSPFSSVLPRTGEIATPVHDVALDGPENSVGLGYNAVDVVQNGRTRLLADAALDVAQVWWIGSGSQLVVKGFDSAIGGDVLKIYGRDGALVGQFAGGLYDITGTPDGFVGLFPSGGGVGLANVDTFEGEFSSTTIWTTGDAAARLIHVQG